MTEFLRVTASILCATSLAWMVYYLVKLLHIRSKTLRYLEDFYASAADARKLSSWGDRIGGLIAGRLPISFDTWEANLTWAQRAGYLKGWGVERLVFMALVYGCLGACVVLVNPMPASLFIPVGAAAYPFIQLRAKANTARKCVIRGLPELATLIAAEMSAGISPEQAIQRASVLPGMLTGLLQEALAYSRRYGRPLFGRRQVPGALVEVSSRAGLPEFLSFATQLDLVAEKGVAGAALMNELARTLAREYRARLDREVEKLSGRLMLATAIFFFIPFVLIILGSFIAPVMAIFK
jgi:tight adherence protein C